MLRRLWQLAVGALWIIFRNFLMRWMRMELKGLITLIWVALLTIAIVLGGRFCL